MGRQEVGPQTIPFQPLKRLTPVNPTVCQARGAGRGGELLHILAPQTAKEGTVAPVPNCTGAPEPGEVPEPLLQIRTLTPTSPEPGLLSPKDLSCERAALHSLGAEIPHVPRRTCLTLRKAALRPLPDSPAARRLQTSEWGGRATTGHLAHDHGWLPKPAPQASLGPGPQTSCGGPWRETEVGVGLVGVAGKGTPVFASCSPGPCCQRNGAGGGQRGFLEVPSLPLAVANLQQQARQRTCGDRRTRDQRPLAVPAGPRVRGESPEPTLLRHPSR